MEDKKMSDLVAKCWSDPEFKTRFVAEPKKVLAEMGVELPAELEIQVVENTDKKMYLVLPPPPAKSRELSDAQLDQVSGGAGNVPVTDSKYTPMSPTRAVVQKLTITGLPGPGLPGGGTMAGMSTCSVGKECIPH